MIMKVSQKTNANGWRRQLVIDFENKIVSVGSFQFLSGDIDGLTAGQFKQMIEYFTSQGFTKTEV